jgi:hypothetical protein
MMADPDETEPYQVKAAQGAFQVVDASGEVVLTCNDEANAGQYAAFLTQAYRRGYKAGYRNGRSS